MLQEDDDIQKELSERKNLAHHVIITSSFQLSGYYLPPCIAFNPLLSSAIRRAAHASHQDLRQGIVVALKGKPHSEPSPPQHHTLIPSLLPPSLIIIISYLSYHHLLVDIYLAVAPLSTSKALLSNCLLDLYQLYTCRKYKQSHRSEVFSVDFQQRSQYRDHG